MFGEAGIHCSLFEAFARGPSASPRPIRWSIPRSRSTCSTTSATSPACATAPGGWCGSARTPAVQSISREVQIGNTGRPLADLLGAPDEASTTGCSPTAPRRSTVPAAAAWGRYDVEDGRSVVDPDVPGPRHRRPARRSTPRSCRYDCKANTSLTTIMIGEHMADRLRAEPPPRT